MTLRALTWPLLVTAVTACGASPSRPSSADSPDALPPAIVALGDSLTSGAGLRPEQAYPALLQRRMDAMGLGLRVINAGVSGDTSADGLRRASRAIVPGTRVLIVALGANDGLRGVPTRTLRANLAAIVEEARGRGVDVLLCGMEAPPLHGLEYSLAFHALFPSLAREYGVPLMPFLLAGVIGRPELNQPDGIHPNAAGQAVIAANVWPYLAPMLAAVD